MSAKQFHHFLNLQQQLTGVRRPVRRAPAKSEAKPDRLSTAVTEAKEWLAGVGRRR